MREGYHATGGDDGCPYSELDEFLCEYVDDTMDPSVRRVFEEYLVSNPVLAEHVRELRHTRNMLCAYGCQVHAPRGLQARLRHRLSSEMLRCQIPRFAIVMDRLGGMVFLASAVAILLIGGLMFSASVQDDLDDFETGAATAGLSMPDPGKQSRLDAGENASHQNLTFPPRSREPYPFDPTWADGFALLSVLTPGAITPADADDWRRSRGYNSFQRTSVEP